MKVTAIIPDEILDEVQKYSDGKNITDSIIKALKDWLYVKHIKSLQEEVSRNPLHLQDHLSDKDTRN